ncbi:MAG: prepilin peptidase [Candidatus Rokuibacteriota bacterium]|nr:MAG: prepilin peptidase [Candidatus Rokubacteria bacterium]
MGDPPPTLCRARAPHLMAISEVTWENQYLLLFPWEIVLVVAYRGGGQRRGARERGRGEPARRAVDERAMSPHVSTGGSGSPDRRKRVRAGRHAPRSPPDGASASDPTSMMALAAVFGLLVGSFLNVVIARLPEGRSLWRPRSACLNCHAPIAWYDNIPVLSFVLLGRRCRQCGQAIPWRYPIVEAGTGAAFGLAYVALGPTRDFAAAALLLALLIAITGIDLAHQIIPDVITLPGIVAGVVANLATGRVTWFESLLGVVVGGGIFFVIIVASRGGMGGGDMKLGAMLGAFLGWKAGLLAVLLGVLAGGIVALGLLVLGLKHRKEAIPFGPFLALGGAIAFLWGEQLLSWYLGRFAL